jgi:hypothetical protein
MEKHRMVSTYFWSDKYTENLSANEKLVYLYLFTCEAANLSGCYQIKRTRIADDTGLDLKSIEAILARFMSDGKIFYQENWLIVRNTLKNQSLTNPKIILGVLTCLKKAPLFIAERLDLDTLSIAYQYLTDIYNKNKNSNKNIKALVLSLKALQDFSKKMNLGIVKEILQIEPLKADTRVKSLIDFFFKAHTDWGRGKVQIDGGKDGNIFKTLLETWTEDELKNKIMAFMKYEDDWMIENNVKHTVGYFKTAINKLDDKTVPVIEYKYKPHVYDDEKKTVDGRGFANPADYEGAKRAYQAEDKKHAAI